MADLSTAKCAAPISKDLSLEGLRGIACFTVFLCHYLFAFFPALTQGFSPDTEIPAKYSWESIVATPFFTVFFNGSFGVAIFFAISGYVLTRHFFVTQDVRYLQRGAAKRYIRLGVPVFTSVMLAWALFAAGLTYTQRAPEIGSAGWPMTFYRDPVLILSALKDGLYGVSLFGSTMLNSPLWTIQIELLGSMMLFATYAMFGTRRPIFNLVFFCVFLIVMFPDSAIQLHCMTIYVGSLLNYVRWSAIGTPVLAVGLGLTGMVLGAYDHSSWFAFLHSIPLPLLPAPAVDLSDLDRYYYNAIGAICLVAAVLAWPALARVVSRPVFVWLGRVSFSLYLLHWPVICSLSFGLMYLLVPLSGWHYGLAALMIFALTTPVALSLSWLFERFVDSPSQRLASRFAQHILANPAPKTQTASRPEDGAQSPSLLNRPGFTGE